jgi:hypothetical protein
MFDLVVSSAGSYLCVIRHGRHSYAFRDDIGRERSLGYIRIPQISNAFLG